MQYSKLEVELEDRSKDSQGQNTSTAKICDGLHALVKLTWIPLLFRKIFAVLCIFLGISALETTFVCFMLLSRKPNSEIEICRKLEDHPSIFAGMFILSFLVNVFGMFFLVFLFYTLGRYAYLRSKNQLSSSNRNRWIKEQFTNLLSFRQSRVGDPLPL